MTPSDLLLPVRNQTNFDRETKIEIVHAWGLGLVSEDASKSLFTCLSRAVKEMNTTELKVVSRAG